MLQKKAGFGIIELMIIIAIMGIIAAFAIPSLLRSRMSANESSASGALKTISSAQTDYDSNSITGNKLTGVEVPVYEYNKADYKRVLESGKNAMLVVYNNRCSFNIDDWEAAKQAFEGAKGSNLVGFRVNYSDSDTSAEEKQLAADLNITDKHTKIFINQDKELYRSQEVWTKDQYSQAIASWAIGN